MRIIKLLILFKMTLVPYTANGEKSGRELFCDDDPKNFIFSEKSLDLFWNRVSKQNIDTIVSETRIRKALSWLILNNKIEDKVNYDIETYRKDEDELKKNRELFLRNFGEAFDDVSKVSLINDFMDLSEKRVERRKKNPKIGFLDLSLKPINESYGKSAGDIVIAYTKLAIAGICESNRLLNPEVWACCNQITKTSFKSFAYFIRELDEKELLRRNPGTKDFRKCEESPNAWKSNIKYMIRWLLEKAQSSPGSKNPDQDAELKANLQNAICNQGLKFDISQNFPEALFRSKLGISGTHTSELTSEILRRASLAGKLFDSLDSIKMFGSRQNLRHNFHVIATLRKWVVAEQKYLDEKKKKKSNNEKLKAKRKSMYDAFRRFSALITNKSDREKLKQIYLLLNPLEVPFYIRADLSDSDWDNFAIQGSIIRQFVQRVRAGYPIEKPGDKQTIKLSTKKFLDKMGFASEVRFLGLASDAVFQEFYRKNLDPNRQQLVGISLDIKGAGAKDFSKRMAYWLRPDLPKDFTQLVEGAKETQRQIDHDFWKEHQSVNGQIQAVCNEPEWKRLGCKPIIWATGDDVTVLMMFNRDLSETELENLVKKIRSCVKKQLALDKQQPIDLRASIIAAKISQPSNKPKLVDFVAEFIPSLTKMYDTNDDYIGGPIKDAELKECQNKKRTERIGFIKADLSDINNADKSYLEVVMPCTH